MPATFGVFTPDNIKTRYREPFITAGVNAKGAITPRGIYRGFRLAAGGSNFTVGILQDGGNHDHLAVYEVNRGDSSGLLDRYSLTIRKTGGNFTINLSALAGVAPVTAYIVLAASYTTSADSSAELRAYTAAEWAALSASVTNEVIVLGTCVIPATGSPAPVTSFNSTGRVSAWANHADEDRPWVPIVRNGGFEQGIQTATQFPISDWTKDPDYKAGAGLPILPVYRWGLNFGGTNVVSGDKSLVYTQQATSTVAQSAGIDQFYGLPVYVGQRFRVIAKIKQAIAPTAGAITLRFYWGDNEGTSSTPAPTDVTLSVLNTTDSSFRKIDQIISAPSGSYLLLKVAVFADSVTSASAGALCYVDEVGVWVEPSLADFFNAATTSPAIDSIVRQVTAKDLILKTGSMSADEDFGVIVRNAFGNIESYGLTTPTSAFATVVVENKLQDSDPPPAVAILGQLWKLGAGLLDTEAHAVEPRVLADYSVATNVDFTCMWQSAATNETVGGFTTPVARLYVSSKGEWVFTVNAMWGTTTWSKDVTGTSATAFRLWGHDGTNLTYRSLRVQFRAAATSGSWADGAWSSTALQLNGNGGNVALDSASLTQTGSIVSTGDMTSSGNVTGVKLLHTGEQRRYIPISTAAFVGTALPLAGNGGYIDVGTSTTKIVVPLGYFQNETLVRWLVICDDQSSGTAATFKLYKTLVVGPTYGAETQIGSTVNSSQAGSVYQGASGLTESMDGTYLYNLVIQGGGAGNVLKIFGVEIGVTKTA